MKTKMKLLINEFNSKYFLLCRDCEIKTIVKFRCRIRNSILKMKLMFSIFVANIKKINVDSRIFHKIIE